MSVKVHAVIVIGIGVARHYKVCSLEPNCNGAASVDPNLSWECIMKVLSCVYASRNYRDHNYLLAQEST